MPAEPLRQITVVVTTACNLACRYCFERRHPGRRPGPRALDETLDRLVAKATDELYVGFTGGEPLMEFERMRAMVQHVRAVTTGATLSFGLLSNGTIFTPRSLSWLARNRFDMQISCDGGTPAQEARAPGSSQRLSRGLSLLRRRHAAYLSASVAAAVTVTPDNVRLLEDSVRHLGRRGIRTIRLAPVMGRPSPQASLRTLDRTFSGLSDAMLDHYLDHGDVPLELFRKRGPRSATRKKSGWVCVAPLGRKVAVDIDGSLVGCVVATRTYLPHPSRVMRPAVEALRMGTLDEPLDEQFERMRRRAEAVGVFTDRARRYSSYGRCVDCQYYDRCHICPLAPAFERDWDDPFRVPDFLCAFNRVMLKYRDRFPPQAPREWIEKAGLKPRPTY